MAVKRWKSDRGQWFDSNGDPLNGGQLFFYVAGSSTKQDTFNSSAGSVANANPLVLDSAGRPSSEIWMTTGVSYKVILANSTDSDPPASPIWSEDNVQGINDATLVLDEWISGPAPTYVSSTSFTVVGDQTSVLTVGRRVKIVDSGGTKYGTIKTSAYTSLTTITLDSQDSDALATPLSTLAYGIFAPTNTSHPVFPDSLTVIGGSADRSKRLRFEVDGFTTATTRVATPPDYDFRLMSQTKGSDVASAGTLNLDTATGDLVDVTGTTTITAITLAEGKQATVRFTGALTLTNGASLVLPGAANITTVAGDVAVFRGYTAGVVRCVSYMPITFPPNRFLTGTAQATTSGSAVDFTNLPAWVKFVQVDFVGVSLSGTAAPIVQLGDSGGIENTGYSGSSVRLADASAVAISNYSSGFLLALTNAVNVIHGSMLICLENPSTNTWVASGTFGLSSGLVFCAVGGSKSLSGVLDRIRITNSGADTFNAGEVNIRYWG